MSSERNVTGELRPEPSLGEDVVALLRLAVAGRRGVILLAAALAVPALWIGWPWLVAAGFAPVLVALAPCAVMCALGLCMGRACKKSEAGPQAAVDPEGSSILSRSAAADEGQHSLAGAEDRLSRPQARPTPSQPSTKEITS